MSSENTNQRLRDALIPLGIVVIDGIQLDMNKEFDENFGTNTASSSNPLGRRQGSVHGHKQASQLKPSAN